MVSLFVHYMFTADLFLLLIFKKYHLTHHMVLFHEKLPKSAILHQFQSQLCGFYNSYNVMQHHWKIYQLFDIKINLIFQHFYNISLEQMDSYCVIFQTIRYDKINMFQLCAFSVVKDAV